VLAESQLATNQAILPVKLIAVRKPDELAKEIANCDAELNKRK